MAVALAALTCTAWAGEQTILYEYSWFAVGQDGKVVMHLTVEMTGFVATVDVPLPESLMTLAGGAALLRYGGKDWPVGTALGDRLEVASPEIERAMMDAFYTGTPEAQAALAESLEAHFSSPSGFEAWKAERITYDEYRAALGKVLDPVLDDGRVRVTWDARAVTVRVGGQEAPARTLSAEALSSYGDGAREIGRVCLAEGLLAVAVDNGWWRAANLYVYEAETGKLLWRERPWSHLAYLQVKGGKLTYWHESANYVAHPEPLLACFRAADGRPYWEVRLGVRDFERLIKAKIADEARAVGRGERFLVLGTR